MPAISPSIEVSRPADEAFAYATDPTRFHEWQQGVLGEHMDDPERPASERAASPCGKSGRQKDR